MTAEEYYQQGNEYRRQGDWQHAINCYMEATASPGSPEDAGGYIELL